MEGRKQIAAGSSSSFTTELFGSNVSASSAGIFGSIFAPSSKVLGRESVRYNVNQKRHDSASEAWKTKPMIPGDSSKPDDDQETRSMLSRDRSSFYQDQRVQPCHLCSSIYYGGQDIYTQSQSSQSSNSVFKKEVGEDDSGSASRGNWWQGSLYY